MRFCQVATLCRIACRYAGADPRGHLEERVIGSARVDVDAAVIVERVDEVVHGMCRKSVDHATVNRWVLQYSPQLAAAFHRRKRPVWISWRLDETSMRSKGQGRYLYRAADKTGQTIAFLLMEERDEPDAQRFLTKAIRRYGAPATITIDGSEANAAAIRSSNQEHGTMIAIRQVTYLNHIVEQAHRAVKRVTRPTQGFKSFNAAQWTLTGIELMPMLRKGQPEGGGEQGQTPAKQFYVLAA